MTSSMSVATASYAVTYSYSNIVIQSSSFASSSISSSYALTLFPQNLKKKAANDDGLVLGWGFMKGCCRWSKTAEYRGIRVEVVVCSVVWGRLVWNC